MSKMLINIPGNITPDNLEDYFGVRSPKLFTTFMSGTIISDNITNGDVIKLLFPNVTIEKNREWRYLDKYRYRQHIFKCLVECSL